MNRSTYRAGSVTDTVIVESLHNRAILFKVEAVELIFKTGPVLRGDCPDQIDVLVRVESGQILLIGIVVVQLGELEVLGEGRGTTVSKWLSS